MAWNQFVGITMLLYALTNPVGAVPIFLAMTRKVESVKIHRIIVLASAAVAVFFMGSALLGKQILNFFNVGLDDFRIAGGLLALMIAFEMFQAQYGRFIQVADETARDEVDIHGLSDHTLCFSAACGAGRAEHHDHSVQRQSRMASQSTACNCFAARSAPNWTYAVDGRSNRAPSRQNRHQRHDACDGAYRRRDRREFHHDWHQE
jgi:MarC family integral membrane protein